MQNLNEHNKLSDDLDSNNTDIDDSGIYDFNNKSTNIKKVNNKHEKKELQKVKRLIISLFLLLFLFVGLVGFGIYMVVKDNQQVIEEDMIPDFDAILGILPGMSEEDIQARLNEVVAKGMMNISINPEPVFKDGKAKGNIRIENVPANHYDFVINITLDETGEELYKSGIVSPGYYIENIKLNKDLPKGRYPATASFKAYLPGTKELMGTASVEILINILN